MPRDFVRDALRRAHTNALANTTVEVRQPSVSYAPGDGFSVSYPDAPDAEIDARVSTPSPAGQKDRGGTAAEVDATIHIRSDVSLQLTGFGEDGKASARLTDTRTGTEFRAETVTDRTGGLTVIQGSER
jgi:hypothetical protein